MQTTKKNALSLRLTAVLLVLVLSISLVPLVSSQAFAAGNHQDTTFTKTSDGSDGDYVTPARGKWDYTSSWAKNVSVSNIKLSFVRSVASWGGSAYYPQYAIDVVSLTKGQGKYLRQWIKENGFTHARIVVTPPRNTTFKLQWSPDSI